MALSFLEDRDENGVPGNLGASAQGSAGEELVEVKNSVLTAACLFSQAVVLGPPVLAPRTTL